MKHDPWAQIVSSCECEFAALKFEAMGKKEKKHKKESELLGFRTSKIQLSIKWLDCIFQSVVLRFASKCCMQFE